MKKFRPRKRAPAAGRMHANIPARPGEPEPRPHFRVPPSLAGPKCTFVSCHYCGYGPEVIPEGGTCPKCGGHSWERFALSARLVPGGSP